jgi:predicted amidohydrolase YtcJ
VDRLLAAGPDPQHCGGKLPVRGSRLYIDGALGDRGAALLKPYSDASGSRGLLLYRRRQRRPVHTDAPFPPHPYAAFQERDRGSIEVGKLADFTVLSTDIMTIPEPQILTSNVVMTISGGEVVYAAPGVLQ